jgi:hypothetical protein
LAVSALVDVIICTYFTGDRQEWGEKQSRVICVRGRLRFPQITLDKILSLLVNVDKRSMWDDQMVEGSIAKQYQWNDDKVSERANQHSESGEVAENGCDVAHLVYRGVPLIVSQRDLCLLRFWQTTSCNFFGRRAYLVCRSVEHEAVPEIKGTIRAELMECGYYLQEGTVGGARFTDVTYVSSLDFKGSVPPVFSNVVLMQQPGTLVQMRNLLEKTRRRRDAM